MTISKIQYAILFICAVALALFCVANASRVSASATSGLPATQSVATTTVVGPQSKVTIFNANPSCTSRIIRTQGRLISFVVADPTNGDVSSSTLSAIIGLTQSASTTVAYDSGLYGCGRMVGYAEASTTITVVEMQ